MKKIALLFFFVNVLQAQNEEPGFSLEIHLDKNLPGYVYLAYGDKVDSSLVVNKNLSFKGTVENGVSSASIFKKEGHFRLSKDLYLENTEINIVAAVELMKINDTLTFISLKAKSISGSRTTDINDAYDDFINLYSSNLDFDQMRFAKVNEIVLANPKNPIAGDLLYGLFRSGKYSNEALKDIYSKIDKDYQNEFPMRKIENKLFPENFVETNKPVFNFILPDQYGALFSSKTLKGKWILINFWASWCAPCREQFPEMKRIYDLFKSKNFEILAISIDKTKTDWLKALSIEKPQWINVIEGLGTAGPIAAKYNLFGVPQNYLIDSDGNIIAKDITPELLEKVLQSVIRLPR